MNELVLERDRANVVSRQVHIFFEARSWDLDFDDIDVGMLSSDHEVKNKVAEAMSVPLIKLANFTVARNEATEDISVNPQATWGFF